MKKTVLIGISSGIAAFKVMGLIKLLKRNNIDVQVIMTEKAAHMVSPKEIEKITGHKVFTQLFEKDFDYSKVLHERFVDHIDVAERASLMVIVPATANTIAKLAHGFADNFLTTTVLAVTSPIIIYPSMNTHMWNNPVVQKNIETLKSLGYQIIEPAKGSLACGHIGKGRLETIEVIYDEILVQLRRKESLNGKKIIVTSGGTIEPIDDVRFIANKSSGKMGCAIAEELYSKGTEVLLLRSRNSLQPRYPIQEETFETADDLFVLIKKYVPQCDVLFHVAAVSDFQLTKQMKGKVSSEKELNLQLIPRAKIVQEIKKMSPKIKLFSFKAESGMSEEKLIETAFESLQKSHADAVIANEVGKNDRGFQADTNEVIIVLKNKTIKKIPLGPKREVAREILEFLLDTHIL